MKTYIKFLASGYLRSFVNVFLIMFSLVFILNIIKEIEFFSNASVNTFYPVYLSFMSSPSIIFEMFPFIFLIATQFFFIKLFDKDEIRIFKYSGLKNITIIQILSFLSFFMGILIITLFYNFSSNLQSYYLQIKNQFSKDKLYLAVINKNGLWIKDIVDGKTSIINSPKIDNNFLNDAFVTTFDKNYELIQSFKSDKIDIKNKEWLAYNSTIFLDNKSEKTSLIRFKSNFDQQRIESLFSNLSSLSLLKLIDLRKNYILLNYSVIDVNLQIHKIITYPIYLLLMTILSSIIMFNTNRFKSNTFKIVIGLFFSVTIYYINNFFNVMGSTEKIPLMIASWAPIFLLTLTNLFMLIGINEK